MPVAVEEDLGGIEALEAVLNHLDPNNVASFEKRVGAKGDDIAFLSDFLNDPTIQSMIEAQDTLEDAVLEPHSADNIELVRDIVDDLGAQSHIPQAVELRDLLCQPHFKYLIEAHDDIAAKNYEDDIEIVPIFSPQQPVFNTGPPSPNSQDAIRMVGIRKTEGEPLGITVQNNEHGLYIARILAGSMVDKQGLLHVGDVIKEINGQEVRDPDQLMDMMRKAEGSMTLKILPSYYDQSGASQVFLKAHFSYEPSRDNLIPCRDAGLAFKEGDILQVLNMDDPNWWQAKKVDLNGPSGLIPSQTLEEKRKAFVRPEYDYTHKSLLCGLMTKKKKVPTATLR